MNVLYEVIGYIGTVMIVVSMMMTSVTWLRIVNMSGSVFSLIYGICTGAWPVVLLNASMITVNVIQLIRLKKKKEENHGTEN